MATLKRGILGGFSGSVANVVGTSWKGIEVMRSKPLSVANPRTAAQTAQRGKFANVVEAGSILLVSVVKPLWDRFAQRQSGFNAFVQANIDKYSETTLISPETYSIGEGNLTGVEGLNLTQGGSTDNIIPQWTDNSAVGNASASDKIYFVVWNQTQNVYEGFGDRNNRSASGDTIDVDHTPELGDVMYVFASFRRADGTAVSNTSYATYTIA